MKQGGKVQETTREENYLRNLHHDSKPISLSINNGILVYNFEILNCPNDLVLFGSDFRRGLTALPRYVNGTSKDVEKSRGGACSNVFELWFLHDDEVRHKKYYFVRFS